VHWFPSGPVPSGFTGPDYAISPVVDGSPTAAAIREAAILLFAERGYSATTMKAIAREVGVGAPAIYNHFDSKQTLLREIVKGTIQQLIDNAHAAIDSSGDISEQLYRAVRGHAAFHAERRFETAIGNREITSLEEPARTRQIAHREEYVRVFERLIARGVGLGRFRTSTPQLTTFAILQMGMGISVWFRREGKMTPLEVGDLYGEFALRMVDAQPAGH
jgi:AcrR family transcriptional regulator